MRGGPVLFAAVVVGAAGACSSAGGAVAGGENKFDPAPLEAFDPCLDGPATWTALYADYFGAVGAPGCASGAVCHVSTSTAGGKVWVCGSTKDSCYAGITAGRPSTDPHVEHVVNLDEPLKSEVLGVVRHYDPNGPAKRLDPKDCSTTPPADSQCAKGIMPQSPKSYVFCDTAMKRITNWLTAGAKND